MSLKIDRKNVESLYDLTPLQQGMFFHSRYGGAEEEVYLTQFRCRLEGALDLALFLRAWRGVFDRHAVLRTSFHWQKLPKPLQVVQRRVDVPFALHDLRGLSSEDQDRALSRFLSADRRRGCQLDRAPLSRVTLLRRAAEQHELIWSHHHLLLDGWSVSLVLQEVFAIYQALANGRSPQLTPPRKYRDFILWLKEQDLAAAETFWRERLHGVQEPGEIDLGPVAVGERAYERVFRTFSVETTHRLESLARSQRVTLNTLFQLAWALLLHRHAQREGGEHRDQVVFGATTAGRPAELQGVERMIGLFINTLPVRVRPSWGQTVGEALRQLQQEQIESRRYEFSPLIDLQKWSGIGPGRALFNTLVVFENLPAQGSAAGPMPLRFSAAGYVQRTNYPLTLAISPRGDELSVRLAFWTDRFPRTAILRLLRTLETQLLAFAEQPDAVLASVQHRLPEVEQHQLKIEWNDRGRRRQPTTVSRLFEEQVSRYPDALAAITPEAALSYGELHRRVTWLTQTLIAEGVEPEERVAIAIGRSCERLIALLGVFGAGAIYVPIDASYPAERIAYMLDNATVERVVTEARFAGLFPSKGNRSVRCLDTWTPPVGAPPAIVRRDEPGRGAYIIYTSGSTGLPKGVLVEHQQLAERAQTMVELFELGPGHRQLNFVSLGFDVSCEEIFVPLVCGATVVLEPGVNGLTPIEVLELCGDRRVSKLNAPASYWHQMVDSLEAYDRQVPTSLEILVTGAEAPSLDKLRLWLARAPSSGRFFNVYGPTEATILASAERLANREGALFVETARQAKEGLAIGKPLRNTTLYVVDERLEPRPLGAAGELLIGGLGISRGYLGGPAMTAERFVADPFAQRTGARLYRTGDLVRHRLNGRLEFIGRIDHQVKIRGFRIELGEIEEALRRHPQVDQAAVLAREDRPGEKRLVAYLVAKRDAAQPGIRELRSFLAESLTDAMIPTAYVWLPSLPLTVNNKLDRRALPAPDQERPELAEAYVAPRTALEHFLVVLWEQVLGVERIGVDDDFFELGGDSLKGAVLINRLEAKLDEYVYVVAIFDSPTITGLAAYLGQHCPAAVEKHFGAASVVGMVRPEERPDGPLGDEHVRLAEQLIVPLAPYRSPPYPSRAAEPNPAMVFVLSPPRSGSTLLRVMLGGHPGLFAPPELDLLSFNTLRERHEAFSGRYSFWLEGALRAWMELLGCDADEARQALGEREASAQPIKAFYREMQERLGERLLVDKTPAYALDPEVLSRAEEDFSDTRYIHLLRHPGGMVQSFEKARIDELFFRYDHPYSVRQLGELVWNLCHHNILGFLRGVPRERQLQVRFEDMVRDPETNLRRICAFLGLDFEPAMLEPYAEKSQRMTDGIHPLAKMLGDVKFHQHRQINPKVADRWQEIYTKDFFGPMTWRLASSFGYERPAAWQTEASGTGKAARIEPLPRTSGQNRFPVSFAQQRLLVVDRLAPGSAVYNMPLAARLRGRLDASALRAAVQLLVARHESLSTRFALTEGAAEQVISPPGDVDFLLCELSALKAEAGRELAEDLARREAARPFDLVLGPLFRVVLSRLSADEAVLLLNTHHAISDGWSMGLLLRELVLIYRALAAGGEIDLPQPAVQYADYAAWQQRRLSGPAFDALLAFWRERLDGASTLLELPSDRPRPAVQNFRGARHRVFFGEALGQRLRQLGQSHGATPFMVFLAALGTLLMRLTNQNELLIGAPVAGRNRQELEGVIGFFVNTLALRLNLTGNPTLVEALRRARGMALDAYRNEEMPFEKLVEALQPERSLAHHPLFQVALVLQNVPLERMSSSGALDVEIVELAPAGAKFDLTFSLSSRGEAFAGSVEFSSDLFDASTIERWMDHFRVLLEGMVDHPDQRVWALPLLSLDEQRHLWTNARREFDVRGSLHQGFAEQARAMPESVALIHGETALSYGLLRTAALRLATHLRGRGLVVEERVGLLAERGFDLVIGLLAILEAGGAYLPLDPSFPPDRRAFMLQDAGARWLLVDRDGESECPAGIEAVPITTSLSLSASLSIEMDSAAVSRPADPDPDRLAYVIYTSGSTGQPKGTLVSHRNVLRLLADGRERFDFKKNDVWTLFHSVAFDFSVWELWGALHHGARLVLVPYTTSRDPRAFDDLLNEERVTILNQTPSAFAQWLSENEERASRLAALRLVIFGGEALNVEILRPWWRAWPEGGAHLINMYGITETTVHVTHRQVVENDLATHSKAIGQPLDDLELVILDAFGQVAPLGVAGELCVGEPRVGGAGLARGYLGRPSLTAERFVPHPASGSPGSRLYRSGDLGRRLREGVGGVFEYLGRRDHQIQIRGFRVELGEIENLLQRRSEVRRAIVLPWDPRPDDRRLVAYLQLDPECLTSAKVVETLRSEIEKALPAYMHPAHYQVLDTLPLTSNGKIDRRALKPPTEIAAGGDSAADFVAPRNEIELRLAKTFGELLGVRPIDVRDDFFALGGHSVLAIRLINEIRRAFGCELQLATLFAKGTVDELGQQIHHQILSGRNLSSERSNWMLLQEGIDQELPLICFPPAGGNLLCYGGLVRALGTEKSVYGFPARGTRAGENPLTSVEAMGRDFFERLRTLKARGPYALFGWSLGGLTAYETALRLQAAGEKVQYLAIVDVHVNFGYQSEHSDLLMVEEILGVSLGLDEAELNQLETEDRWQRILEAGHRQAVIPSAVRMAEFERSMRLVRAGREAAMAYRPTSIFSGQIHLFRANERPPHERCQDPDMGWRRRASEGVIIEQLPGSHTSLMQAPAVEKLSNLLRPELLRRLVGVGG